MMKLASFQRISPQHHRNYAIFSNTTVMTWKKKASNHCQKS